MDRGLQIGYYINKGFSIESIPLFGGQRRVSGKELCNYVDCPLQEREVPVEECLGCDQYDREEGSCGYK
jgi:hypothetical protein